MVINIPPTPNPYLRACLDTPLAEVEQRTLRALVLFCGRGAQAAGADFCSTPALSFLNRASDK